MKTLHLLLATALTLASAGAKDTLRIEGSNTFGEKLGPLLVSAFTNKSPGVSVSLKRPGSGEGLSALIAGRADIAPTSRPANRKELAAAKAAGLTLESQSIGSYGVAVVINAKNPVQSLKPAQVRGIFTGKITNWKQVGGPDAAIRPVILDKSTGARAGFQMLAMRDQDYAPSALALRTYAEIAAAVAADATAIGYTDIGPLPAGTRAVLIGGQPANSTAIYEGVYPYSNELFLYTAANRQTAPSKAFIRFVLSREGQRIVRQAGFVPRLARPLASEGLAP